ncbi:MAG: TonB-dependent receptor [Myxococcota bacterium]|nr:TonB-dependent receptor [Myxococcota bacterium]
MLILLSAVVFAEPIDPFTEPDEAERFRIERKVVTVATRYAQTVEQAPSIVTVITAQDIRRFGYRKVTDILQSIPGIYIKTSKEGRDLAWFRGVISDDNNKILLLVDGVPWYDGGYTHAWLDEYIPLFHVKQVEIIKGPGSAVYGTNAFSGVINIVTYSPEELNGGIVRFSTGSFARQEIGAVAGDTYGDVAFKVYARGFSVDGDGMDFNPKNEPNLLELKPRRSVNGGAQLKWKGLDLRYDFVDYKHTYFFNSQYDIWGALLESSDEFYLNYRDDFFQLSYTANMGTMGTVKPYLYTQRYYHTSNYAYLTGMRLNEDGENIDFGQTMVHTIKFTERYGAGIEANLHPDPNHITVLGVGTDINYVAQFEDQKYLDGSSVAEPIEFGAPSGSFISDIFAFAQHTWTASWWLELTGGARLDAYSHSGMFISPRAGVLMLPDNSTTLKLLYGRAFRAPSARETLVYIAPDESGDVPFTNGNDQLGPEVIDTIETEINGRVSSEVLLRGALYYSLMNNEINKVENLSNKGYLGHYYYANQGATNIVGGEIEGQYRPPGFAFDGSFVMTYAMHDKNESLQYEFPPQMFHLRAGWNPAPSIWTNLTFDAYSYRPRADWSPDARLADGQPFGLMNLSMSSESFMDGRIRMDAAIRNVLDSDYDTLSYLDDANAVRDGEVRYPNDYQGEGRNFYLGVEAKF